MSKVDAPVEDTAPFIREGGTCCGVITLHGFYCNRCGKSYSVEDTAVEVPPLDVNCADRAVAGRSKRRKEWEVAEDLACRERQLLASLAREQAEKARTRELEKRLAEAIELLREGTETATWSKWANDARAFLSQGSGER